MENIGLIIYILGWLCGCAFGIAISMLVDLIINGVDEDEKK